MSLPFTTTMYEVRITVIICDYISNEFVFDYSSVSTLYDIISKRYILLEVSNYGNCRIIYFTQRSAYVRSRCRNSLVSKLRARILVMPCL